jgi:hypothetical protein
MLAAAAAATNAARSVMLAEGGEESAAGAHRAAADLQPSADGKKQKAKTSWQKAKTSASKRSATGGGKGKGGGKRKVKGKGKLKSAIRKVIQVDQAVKEFADQAKKFDESLARRRPSLLLVSRRRSLLAHSHGVVAAAEHPARAGRGGCGGGNSGGVGGGRHGVTALRKLSESSGLEQYSAQFVKTKEDQQLGKTLLAMGLETNDASSNGAGSKQLRGGSAAPAAAVAAAATTAGGGRAAPTEQIARGVDSAGCKSGEQAAAVAGAARAEPGKQPGKQPGEQSGGASAGAGKPRRKRGKKNSGDGVGAVAVPAATAAHALLGDMEEVVAVSSRPERQRERNLTVYHRRTVRRNSMGGRGEADQLLDIMRARYVPAEHSLAEVCENGAVGDDGGGGGSGSDDSSSSNSSSRSSDEDDSSDGGAAAGESSKRTAEQKNIDAEVKHEMRRYRRGKKRAHRRQEREVERKRLGNLYSDKALLQREALRFHPCVTTQLHYLFACTDVDHSGDIDKYEFRVVFKHLYSTLQHDEHTPEEVLALADREFRHDTLGSGRMDRRAFMDAFFQLADTWTEDISAEAYGAFLEGIVACFHMSREELEELRRVVVEQDQQRKLEQAAAELKALKVPLFKRAAKLVLKKVVEEKRALVPLDFGDVVLAAKAKAKFHMGSFKEVKFKKDVAKRRLQKREQQQQDKQQQEGTLAKQRHDEERARLLLPPIPSSASKRMMSNSQPWRANPGALQRQCAGAGTGGAQRGEHRVAEEPKPPNTLAVYKYMLR